MVISAAEVKKLRDATGLSMMECKKALEETGGDQDKAVQVLRKKGLQAAEKRAGRSTGHGLVHCYMHHTRRVGVMCQINCETDFVARNADFQQFAKDLCLHVCMWNPLVVSREQVPANLVEAEREIAREQVKDKPLQTQEKIIEGKVNKFFSEKVLLDQPWIHDDKRTVDGVLKELISKIGENLRIVRFSRFDVGDQ